MKLAIFSDTHLGYGCGTEREQESFENAEKALKICLEQGADCILLPGDVFDSAVPSQEEWRETFRIFSEAKSHPSNMGVRRIKNGQSESLKVKHIPIIAIHGTHEFRGKRFANALEVMEKAGFLFYLHAGCIELEKDGEKIAIHGLGGVPEKKALDVLKAFNPQPVEGRKNILVLHQSIKELLPFDDEMIASIGFSDLPGGFDLIVNGHFHWLLEQDLGEKKFFIPGSTIITQMKKLECKKPKSVTVFDTKTMKASFFEIPEQRKMFYETINFENASAEQVKEKVKQALQKILENGFEKKPLIRLKLKGTLEKGVTSADIILDSVLQHFSGKAIVSVGKDFSSDSFKKKVEELRLLQKNRKSISSMGLELLEKNLLETRFEKNVDVRELFELLEAGKIEDAIKLFSKK